jgi:hypothetical protein
VAFAEHDLSAVEADGLDAEANLAGLGLGEWEFVELQDLGAAEGVEANDLCGCCGGNGGPPYGFGNSMTVEQGRRRIAERF